MTLVLLAASFPERAASTLNEDERLYGATYAAWRAQDAATDQIATLAQAQFRGHV
jgi:hypothetical protein